MGVTRSIAVASRSPDSCDSATMSVARLGRGLLGTAHDAEDHGLVMSATMRPRVLVRPVGSARAIGLTR